ncbi:hypothetical protein [Streptomyces niveiscabiei]|uniref:Carrier domain-containing protein n=1 Tax=Streptomyces niveiscabiei TaxID=164115 RepID=A0ABW9I7M7_9ACTN
MKREELRGLLREVLTRRNPSAAAEPERLADGALLSHTGLRSLDFSEVCLRLEDDLGKELNFEARPVRELVSVSDLLDFLELLGQENSENHGSSSG